MRGPVVTAALAAMLLAAACKRPPPKAELADGASSALAFASRGDAAVRHDDAGGDAIGDASVLDGASSTDAGAGAPSASPISTQPEPYGTPRTSAKAWCVLGDGYISARDRTTWFAEGDDLLALVNRSATGQLPPDYAPSDLVDIRTGKAAPARACDKLHCLRVEAAGALRELLAGMKGEGFPGRVVSAFRGYGTQCGTFGSWAGRSSFCQATEQSAFPGHSQHQLGTTVDLFTEDWARDPRGVFREGFGCTPGGKWIREHAAEYGFVMSYPLHPDDRHPRQSCTARWDIPVRINPRTGYRYEHWHLRYIGREAAARFAAAVEKSGPGTAAELTLEQWLRSEKGLGGPDADLPVCDRCNCGACSTLAPVGESPCDRKGGAVHLDEVGRPIVVDEAPSMTSAARAKAGKWSGSVVEVSLDVPPGLITQTPIVGLDTAGYAPGTTYERLAPFPGTEPRAYPPLAGAWVVAVEPVPNDVGVAWPYRAGMAPASVGQIYNRANVLLPTHGGKTTVKIPLPPGVHKARVALLQGGVPRGPELAIDLE